MKINSVRLTAFGKFKNKQIDFGDGLNIVKGKNEAGKSTVMAFIKGMLYGFSGRGGVGVNDRKKFIPWDGDTLSGEMTVTDNSENAITLIRKTGKTQAKDEYSTVNAVTGEEVSFDAAEQLGIGEEGFKNTVYIKQLESAITGQDDEITNKLINMIQSGEEQGGYHKAYEALTDEMRKFKLFKGNGGLIYELQNKISVLTEEYARAERLNKEQLSAICRRKELEEQNAEIESRLKNIREEKQKAKVQEIFIKVQDAKNKKSQSLLELDIAKKAKTALSEKLMEYRQFETEADDIIFESVADISGEEEQIALCEKQKKSFKTYAFLFFGISAVCAAVSVLTIYMAIPFGAALIAGIFLLASSGKKAKEIKSIKTKILNASEKNQKKAEELAKYGCKTLKEYNDKTGEFKALKERMKTAEEKIEKLICESEEAAKAAEKFEAEMKEKYGDSPDCQIAKVDTEALEAEESSLMAKLDFSVRESERIKGQLLSDRAGMRTLDIIEAERQQAKDDLLEAEEKYAALEVALKTLDTAYEKLSRYFAPALNKRASEILSKITGKDEKLLADKKYNVTMDRDGLRELAYFSCGTADQVYLALRIAIIDIVLGENAPLFLDDSFAQYDEERCERTLGVLADMSEKRQIIVFTCKDITYDKAKIIEL